MFCHLPTHAGRIKCLTVPSISPEKSFLFPDIKQQRHKTPATARSCKAGALGLLWCGLPSHHLKRFVLGAPNQTAGRMTGVPIIANGGSWAGKARCDRNAMSRVARRLRMSAHCDWVTTRAGRRWTTLQGRNREVYLRRRMIVLRRAYQRHRSICKGSATKPRPNASSSVFFVRTRFRAKSSPVTCAAIRRQKSRSRNLRT
jgi:hypothetical protein